MKISNRLQLLGKVASLYYEDKKSQAEIARQLGYSRSAISRLLLEAREKGVVEINIHHPVERSHYHEYLLKQVFGLQDVYVVTNNDESFDQLIRTLGRSGVDVVMEHLNDESTIGITWGHTAFEFVHAMRARRWPDVKVVQMMGALGKEGRYFDGPGLTMLLAGKLGGQHYVPYVPLMVESDEVYQGLSNQPNIREFLEITKNMDIAVVGLGSMSLEYSGVYQAGYLSLEDMKFLRENGAVGELCGYFFDINGKMLDVEFHNRLFSTNVKMLAESSCKVIAIAGGKNKTTGLLGALRGKYLDILITDSVMAEDVLKMESRLSV